MPAVETGLERLLADPPAWFRGLRFGLLCNPASVDRRLRHARTLLRERFGDRLRALFSPQHGFWAEKQDNMVESDDGVDPELGLPVFSLYGKTRVPSREMFTGLDALVVDLQDVGTRVYTFASTLAHCMETAGAAGIPVVVLDRPNPLGGAEVEGNLLRPECASFVGRFPLPMRHGMTFAELGRWIAGPGGVACELRWIPMRGWRRSQRFPETGLPWIPPSPNLPSYSAACVYPGQVLWEGTNVSEGRGTTQPFELFGAPFLDLRALAARFPEGSLPGVFLRPVVFEPTAHKWCGRPCRGFQIHVTDADRYRPYATTLRLLQAVLAVHPRDFAWRPPPYEYEFERAPIDLLVGDAGLRRRLEALEPVERLEASWQEELAAFRAASRAVHLYA